MRNKPFKINDSFPRNLLRRLGKPAPFLILVVVARWPERMKRHERHANTFDDQGIRTGIDLKRAKLAMDLNLRGKSLKSS